MTMREYDQADNDLKPSLSLFIDSFTLSVMPEIATTFGDGGMENNLGTSPLPSLPSPMLSHHRASPHGSTPKHRNSTVHY